MRPARLAHAQSPRIATEPGPLWQAIEGVTGTCCTWPDSSYIAELPFFADFSMANAATHAESVHGARIMALQVHPLASGC